MIFIKIIFLDVDGVLNCIEYVKQFGKFGFIVDPVRMEYLKEIVENTGAKIVLSTSWREYWDKNMINCKEIGFKITETFLEYDLFIYDKTPYINFEREREIKAWLDSHDTIANYVVLDDLEMDTDFLDGHFVMTHNENGGLCEADVKQAIEILNK